jgi:hypothetical protein
MVIRTGRSWLLFHRISQGTVISAFPLLHHVTTQFILLRTLGNAFSYYSVGGVSVFDLWNMRIETSERVTYQKYAGRDWREGLEGEGRGTLNCLLPVSYLHSVVCMMGFPVKASGQKRWRLLYSAVVLLSSPTLGLPSWSFSFQSAVSPASGFSCSAPFQMQLFLLSCVVTLWSTVACLLRSCRATTMQDSPLALCLLLFCSMWQDLSWEAGNRLACQWVSCLLWKPVYYHVHTTAALDFVLSQTNPIYIFTASFLKYRPAIMLFSRMRLGSPNCCPPFRRFDHNVIQLHGTESFLRSQLHA